VTEKKHESAADRQRAYRERLAKARAETEPSNPDTTPPPEEGSEGRDIEELTVEDPVEAKGERAGAAGAPSARSPSADEEAYVAHHLEQTKAYAASFTSKEKREGLEARLVRAEAYARWRFRAFHSGEVASL
jgi:hypothetical protein